MAARSHLLPLSSSSSRSFLLRSLTSASPCSPPNPNNQGNCALFGAKFGRCYSGSYEQTAQEITKAPSTAEEFKRVAEEKLKKAKQGVANQGTEEATIGDGKAESAKHQPGADHRRRTEDD